MLKSVIFNLLSNSVCKLVTSDIVCVWDVLLRLLNEVWWGLFVSPVCELNNVKSVLLPIWVSTLPL